MHTCSKEDLLNLNPTIYGELDNEVDSYLAWTVENLEGSKWNSFALQTNEDVSSFGFSIYARWEGDEFVSALAQTGQTMLDRTRSAWDMPIGIAGFTQFRYVFDTIASAAPSINAIVFQYCKPSGSGTCPGIGNYPSVGEGEISPAKCAEGFRGYAYRECHDGVLGEVKNDKCEYKLPEKLAYENNNMEFVLNTEVSSGVPSYKNIITRFFMQDSTPLPDGLTLNEQKGEITGKPIAQLNTKTFTVRAENPVGQTYVAITISVRKGYCMPEDVFERTDVGETAVFQCALQGSYVGTQKRACVLGEKDGEWQKASGFCMPVMVIVLIVVVVIVIIAVVVFLLMRTRSKKAVDGVKGKAAKTAGAKKTATKTVKVWRVCLKGIIGMRGFHCSPDKGSQSRWMCEKGVTTNTSLDKRNQLFSLGDKNALQFEMRQPFLGDRFLTQCSTDDIATHSSRGVAISRVIDRPHHGALQILGTNQRRPHGNCHRFLANPALSQERKGIRVFRSLCRIVHSVL